MRKSWGLWVTCNYISKRVNPKLPYVVEVINSHSRPQLHQAFINDTKLHVLFAFVSCLCFHQQISFICLVLSRRGWIWLFPTAKLLVGLISHNLLSIPAPLLSYLSYYFILLLVTSKCSVCVKISRPSFLIMHTKIFELSFFFVFRIIRSSPCFSWFA